MVSYMHMSEETQTPPQEPTPSLDEHWDNVLELQASAEAARRITTTEDGAATLKDAKERNNTTGKKVLAIVAGVTLVAGASVIAVDRFKSPEFSLETIEFVAQPNDGLQVAAEHIKGIESIDVRDAISHIAGDPANIDVLKDGLQPGETLIIPDHVEK